MDEATTQVNDEIARLKAENEQLDNIGLQVCEMQDAAVKRAAQAESDLRACAPIVRWAEVVERTHRRTCDPATCGTQGIDPLLAALRLLSEETKARLDKVLAESRDG